MSPKAALRHRVARHRAQEYWEVASRLMESAHALLSLGDEEYGNAVAILLVHAVISSNDAVTIQAGEVRSSSDRHADAQRLLQEVVRDVPPEVVRAFAAVIQAKFESEYSGELVTRAAARRLAKAERFHKWAERKLS